MEVEPIPIAVIAALAAELPPPIISTPEEIKARRAIRQATLPPPQPWKKRRYVLVTEKETPASTDYVTSEEMERVVDAITGGASETPETPSVVPGFVRKFTAGEFAVMLALSHLAETIRNLEPSYDDDKQRDRLDDLVSAIDREIRIRPLSGALDHGHFAPGVVPGA